MPCSPEWDEAFLAAPPDDEDPGDDLDLWADPDSGPPPGLDDAQLAAMINELAVSATPEIIAAYRRLGAAK